MDAYNKSQQRVHVDFEQVPSGQQGGYAKLSNAARAGNAPDVGTIEYPQVPGFAMDGVARDLTPLISDRLRGKLLPQALALTTFEGRVFSVPQDVEPMVFLYRRDLFAKHHIRVPRTWAEFERAARAVERAAPGSRIATFPTDGGHHLAGFAWQAGARWFDTKGGTWTVSMTDRPTRKVTVCWQRLIDKGLVFLNPVDTQAGSAQVGRGAVFGKLTGAWDAGGMMAAQPGQKGKWGVAPLPQWDLSRPRVGTHGGSTFAITKDSRRPEGSHGLHRVAGLQPAGVARPALQRHKQSVPGRLRAGAGGARGHGHQLLRRSGHLRPLPARGGAHLAALDLGPADDGDAQDRPGRAGPRRGR